MKSIIEEVVENNKNLDIIVFPEYYYYHPTSIEKSRKVAEKMLQSFLPIVMIIVSIV